MIGIQMMFGNVNLFLVISKNSLFFSIPINFLFNVLQATPMEPLPIQKSKQVSPLFEKYFNKCSKTNCGFSVNVFIIFLFLLVILITYSLIIIYLIFLYI